jgi:hypothetical protein
MIHLLQGFTTELIQLETPLKTLKKLNIQNLR